MQDIILKNIAHNFEIRGSLFGKTDIFSRKCSYKLLESKVGTIKNCVMRRLIQIIYNCFPRIYMFTTLLLKYFSAMLKESTYLFDATKGSFMDFKN